MIHIRALENKSDWEAFLSRSPSDERRNLRARLDLENNPFFAHAYRKPIVALRNSHSLGRAVGYVDDRLNQILKVQLAFFGCFDCEDHETGDLLMSEIVDWAKGRGATHLIGPVMPDLAHRVVLGWQIKAQVNDIQSKRHKYYLCRHAGHLFAVRNEPGPPDEKSRTGEKSRSAKRDQYFARIKGL